MRVQAVAANLKDGGERAPEPPPGFFPVAPQTCPVCGADVSPNAKACPECGACEKSGWSGDTDADGLGLSDDVVAIRFLPDGFFDDSSVRRIVIRQGTVAALELVPTANRPSYEVRTAANE